jgi:hypothetical protein
MRCAAGADKRKLPRARSLSPRDMSLPRPTTQLSIMKLPNAETARVEPDKVRDYLVSRTHAEGRWKARGFELAFGAGSTDSLVHELLCVAGSGDVSERVLTVYGSKYVVDGCITGPAGTALVRTIWLLERRSSEPRLITACVLEFRGHA